jgi:hypothetical protein
MQPILRLDLLSVPVKESCVRTFRSDILMDNGRCAIKLVKMRAVD